MVASQSSCRRRRRFRRVAWQENLASCPLLLVEGPRDTARACFARVVSLSRTFSINYVLSDGRTGGRCVQGPEERPIRIDFRFIDLLISSM